MLLLLCYFDVIPRFLYVTILQLYKLIPEFEFFQNPAIDKSKSKKLEKALKYKTIGHKKALHLNRNGSDYKVFLITDNWQSALPHCVNVLYTVDKTQGIPL